MLSCLEDALKRLPLIICPETKPGVAFNANLGSWNAKQVGVYTTDTRNASSVEIADKFHLTYIYDIPRSMDFLGHFTIIGCADYVTEIVLEYGPYSIYYEPQAHQIEFCSWKFAPMAAHEGKLRVTKTIAGDPMPAIMFGGALIWPDIFKKLAKLKYNSDAKFGKNEVIIPHDDLFFI